MPHLTSRCAGTIFLSFLFLSSLSSATDQAGLASATQEKSVGKIVSGVYHDYIAALAEDSLSRSSRSRDKFLNEATGRLTPRLIDAIRQNDKVCASTPNQIPMGCKDWDMMLGGAQDFPEKADGTTRIETVRVSGSGASVRVRVCFEACLPAARDNDWILEVSLVKRGPRWLVDDVNGPISRK